MWFIIALTAFATCLGIFGPVLVNLFLQYSKESSAPEWLVIHPYIWPMCICLILILGSVGFLIWAAKKRKDELQEIKDRLDKIEKK